MVLGDSLSAEYGLSRGEGWVALLEKRLADDAALSRWKVVNASISGETTAGGLARLPQLLQQHRPALVIIELGGHRGAHAAAAHNDEVHGPNRTLARAPARAHGPPRRARLVRSADGRTIR